MSNTLRIERDECYGETPWGECDPITIYHWHPRYNLGEEISRDSDEEMTLEEEIIDIAGQDGFVFPLFMYDHSGLAFSTGPFSCGWDSGQVGVIFVPKDEHYTDEDKAAKGAAFRVKMMNWQQNNDCWGFIVEDEEGENIDSCWGFWGCPFDDTEELAAVFHAHISDDFTLEQVKEAVEQLTV